MDAIADHIWQSTICAAAAGVLALICRRNNASVRYWIWFAAAVKFLVPVAALTAAANSIPLPQATVAAGVALDAAALVFRASAIPHLSGPPAMSLFTIWLAGTVVVLGRSAWQWRCLAADARNAPPIVDGVVHDSLRSVERAEGVRKPTPVVATIGRLEPGVLGMRKPVLLWPRHLTDGLSDTQIETIVAHEVCHIVRRDNLLALVQIVVCALFWFHPLVWWIGARLVDERERVRRASVGARRQSVDVRREHLEDVSALYRVAARQRARRHRRGPQTAHRPHHEERARAPLGVPAKGRADGGGTGVVAAADRGRCFCLPARRRCQPDAGLDSSGALGGHRPRGEPSWWKHHDAENDSRNASAVHRSRNTGKSPR